MGEEGVLNTREAPTAKTWWAPVWRGLVADPSATHYRKLDGALWLLLYCILHADRATGWLPYRLGTIARSTGIPRRTIQRWLARLRREGYVVVEERGKRPWVGVLRWKSLRGARQP